MTKSNKKLDVSSSLEPFPAPLSNSIHLILFLIPAKSPRHNIQPIYWIAHYNENITNKKICNHNTLFLGNVCITSPYLHIIAVAAPYFLIIPWRIFFLHFLTQKCLTHCNWYFFRRTHIFNIFWHLNTYIFITIWLKIKNKSPYFQIKVMYLSFPSCRLFCPKWFIMWVATL